jgi:hypothetical protein
MSTQPNEVLIQQENVADPAAAPTPEATTPPAAAPTPEADPAPEATTPPAATPTPEADPAATPAAKNPTNWKKIFMIGGIIVGVVAVVGVTAAAVYIIGPSAIVAAATTGLSSAAAGLLTFAHTLANAMAFVGQHTVGYVFNLSPIAATAVGSVVSFTGVAAILGAGRAVVDKAVDFMHKSKDDTGLELTKVPEGGTTTATPAV